MTPEQIEQYENKVAAQTDGHFCYDWDGLAVSAWTQEYNSCIDYPKSRLGRVINWFVMKRWNLRWWLDVGLPDWWNGGRKY